MAKKLNIPLVCGRIAEVPFEGIPQDYPHPIESLAANRAPSEKCDPLDQQFHASESYDKADIRYAKRTKEETESGHYSLMKSRVLWRPGE
ncbi:hypothetical protein DB41_AV00270 [Neochlamydia sp. TUME1]|uniref:hypothetical protein n=1 Tax=Neochlamydia sp. TUME1 TaxID=1478174 RepID=UPI00057E20BA|nr:hypothetical protein [Neochlamydia sp. TUME1]KIC71587.1 hypothetical protein DB41_AV00270 [Neochlamydia sp. TUME1]